MKKFTVYSLQFTERMRRFFGCHLSTVTCQLRERGFTLIEMLVAVSLFTVVMFVSVSALLALVGANRKAQALQSVMNNLNITLDGMVRALRMGTHYECGGTTPVGNQGGGGNDCLEGAPYMSFIPFGVPPDNSNAWVYAYDGAAKRILKSENGGSYVPITADSVDIDSLTFYVLGTVRGDTTQPKVVVEVKGTAGADRIKTKTTFSIQATAVQRLLDL